MFFIRTLLSILMLAGCLFLPLSSYPDLKGSKTEKVWQENWIVAWRQRANPAFWKQAVQLRRFELAGREIDLVRPKKNVDPNGWFARWRISADVRYMQPDRVYQLNEWGQERSGKEQESFNHFYYLGQIRAREAWKEVPYSHHPAHPVVVAVVDTGVDLKHPALAPLLVPGVNILNQQKPPQDHFGHGTEVAGVVAATWGAMRKEGEVGTGKIMPIKVMEDGSDGEVYFTAEGIEEAIKRNANIIVLAQGSWSYSKLMEEAVREAEKKGVLVVAAVGNAEFDLNGKTVYDAPLYYPAAFPSVLAVGSVKSDGSHEPTSNQGDGIDLTAPGDLITTTKLGGGFKADSGTSFAAPQAAGVAALVWQRHPDYTPGQIRQLLCQTARKGPGEPRWDRQKGYGILDAGRALSSRLKRDAFEPNDEQKQAMPLSLDQEMDAVLRPGDEDWFQMALALPGTLIIHIGQVYGHFQKARLTVANPVGKDSHSYLLKGVNLLRVPVKANPIFLGFTSPAGDVPVSYRFQVNFIPQADSYEPNDGLTQAKRLPFPSQLEVITGTLHKQGDQDWYRLHLPRSGEVEVTVEPLTPRFDPVLTQMPQGDWQNWKLDHNGAGEAETLKVSGRKGDLMFSVADYGGNIIDEPYHLIIKVLPASGDGNDHSTLVKAVPLPQAKWVKGEFTEGAAWDWYVFNTKQRETATFLYQANQPVKSLEWAIYDADLLAISSGTVTLAKGERFSKTVSLPPGRHYIRVRTDERHPVSYQIQIKKTKNGRKQKVNPTKQ
jgi:hypothetical protein